MVICNAAALLPSFGLNPRHETAAEHPQRRGLDGAAPAHLRGPSAVGRSLPAVDVRGERRRVAMTTICRPVTVSTSTGTASAGAGLPASRYRRRHETAWLSICCCAMSA
jgi:hypothetical protein